MGTWTSVFKLEGDAGAHMPLVGGRGTYPDHPDGGNERMVKGAGLALEWLAV